MMHCSRAVKVEVLQMFGIYDNKKVLAKEIILNYLILEGTFEIHTDAGDRQLGAVIP